jgi:multidrug efflux pump subunit AcrA (membrane-fusion protein)
VFASFHEVAQNALLVPQKAVTELLGKQFASVVLAGDKIEQRPIRTGARIGELWLVEEGLKAGERIVVEGLRKRAPAPSSSRSMRRRPASLKERTWPSFSSTGRCSPSSPPSS